MSTVGTITLEPHIGRMGTRAGVVEVQLAQSKILDGEQLLGFVGDQDNPPINLAVRVSAEDAAEIQRQVDALIGKPTRDLHMPPAVTLRMLKRATAIADASGQPYEVEEVHVADEDDQEDNE